MEIDLDAQAANDEQLTDEDKQMIADIDQIIAESGEAAPEEEQQTNVVEISTADALMGVITPAFDILAPNWEVTHNEKRALSESYGLLLDKWFPDGGLLDKYAVEFAAIGMTVTIFAPRVGMPRIKPKEKPKEEVREAANDPENFGGFSFAG